MWKVSGGKLTELSPEESQPPLVLSSGGCYIICYEFCPGVDARVRRFVIYAWQGAMAARQDIAAGALCLNDVQVRVRTLKDPTHPTPFSSCQALSHTSDVNMRCDDGHAITC